jgi:2-keto-4-pentenoate hydratase/2-oxohepta-3-ene-1,7-dioic acid hydratase in catechol pathway
MKLITFIQGEQIRAGAVVNQQVFDSLADPAIPSSMLAFLNAGTTAFQTMQKLIDTHSPQFALADVKLLAPIPRPGKFLGVGLNYADHIDETGRDRPEYPTIFTKQSTCVIGPEAPIHLPKISDKLDYECELAFVIGTRCRNVSPTEAPNMIAGYTIVNDVTVRDWQNRSPTWTLGKSFDTHGPMGPWLVTADELGDPHQLGLTTWIDNEQRQNSNTRYMLFNCFELLSHLSQVMTLEPGDVISTGTPSGVGVKMQPRGYLKAGQTAKITIEGIGTLSNPVINEPEGFFVPQA